MAGADIDMSLDDIIKKRFSKPSNARSKFSLNDNRPPQGQVKRFGGIQRAPFIKKGVEDARLKIVRNKLRKNVDGPVAVDARYRLEALRQRPRLMQPAPRREGMILRRTIQGDVPLGRLDRHITAMDVDDFGDEYSSAPLRCTIRNEGMRRRPFDWDRPVDESEEFGFDRIRVAGGGLSSHRESFTEDPDWKSLTVSVKNQAGTMGILKRSHSIPQAARPLSPPIIRTAPLGDPSHGRTLSDRFCRDRNAEAATKIRALKAQLEEAQQQNKQIETGHRIVVSNLVTSVTHEDVKELFADIGELLSSKVVRPGVAEVVYRHYEDAVKAVDIYHDRQLDDQPMKCLLVKTNQTFPKKMKANFELDMNALRNALHKKATS